MPEQQKKPVERPGRWAVQATNDVTGEIWAIHDTREVCEEQLALRLAEWGQDDPRVEWARVGDEQ